MITVGQAGGRIYVLEADIKRRTPKTIADAAVRNFQRWSECPDGDEYTIGKNPVTEHRAISSSGSGLISHSGTKSQRDIGAGLRPCPGIRPHFLCLAVETNVFQVVLKDMLEEISRQERLFIPIRGIKNFADKTARIASLSALIENGTILFRRDQRLLIEQLIEFPKGAHDDGPDALEMAVRQLRHHSAPRIRFV